MQAVLYYEFHYKHVHVLLQFVKLISNLIGPNGPVRPLICALIGGAQPTMAGGPLSPGAIKRGGAGGSNHEVDLSRPPHRQTLNPI